MIITNKRVKAMRPLVFNRRLVSSFRGILAKRFASRHVTEKLTLALPTKASKRAVVDELKRHRTSRPVGALNGNSDHAAIFASPDFATWLEDETFMSSINVVSAVVDGLTPKRLFGEPQTGLSILYSSNSIFSNLWKDEELRSNVNQDTESSVSFISRTLPGNCRYLKTTLPLANTIFQTGRRSTLFASKWQRKSNRPLTLTTMREKMSQKICPSLHPTSDLVIAGLGNIVRQVEINNSPTPASKELEDLIPKVFDARSKLDETYSPRPIGVWCWVIPPGAVDEHSLFDLKVFQAESTQSEAELAVDAMATFSKLISSKCRLHKILSGGGGWGLKQGLLSLDPKTEYSLSEQDDVEMFIKAFQERNSPGSSEGLATPGSYLMFCIEPHWTEEEARSSQQLTPIMGLGVASNNDEDVNPTSRSDKIEVIDNHFGVVSKSGLFLKSEDEKKLYSTRSWSVGPRPPLTTKVDLPQACLLL
ncbi:hypothetical protein F4818DRAFT_251224 [Hypoxylon cercidicola]|nr:hypothetical protein F4818DRAFT_251224 [Hypoxylon cercidicola]